MSLMYGECHQRAAETSRNNNLTPGPDYTIFKYRSGWAASGCTINVNIGEKCVILAEVQFEARGLQCAEDKIASLPNGIYYFFHGLINLKHIFCHYECTMINCESKEIVEAANIAISNLLPTKSRSLYDIAYNRFKKVVR
ncbi:hypothetical protein NQ317_004173 [Molorchus minor]|uniref:Uncharacterized protein n=1 Tax=Molorchus minor TaxID=1323400 RepID=A0ABQ9JSF8_9CUCU|nr:hypothetical protein NQ317_004173 [Molorchus minor]